MWNFFVNNRKRWQSQCFLEKPVQQDPELLCGKCSESSLGDTNRSLNIEVEKRMVQTLREILPGIHKGTLNADLVLLELQEQLEELRQLKE